MRCICCDKILPPTTIYRSILIAHPTLPNKTTTMRVVEEFCHTCAVKSRPSYLPEEEEDITDLGLNIPEKVNYDY